MASSSRSTYAPWFLERYRAAQVARVQRLDAIARAHLARHEEADRAGFEVRPFPERQRVLQGSSSTTAILERLYRAVAPDGYTERPT